MRESSVKDKLLLPVIWMCLLTVLFFVVVAIIKQDLTQFTVDSVGIIVLSWILYRVKYYGETKFYSVFLAVFLSFMVSVVIYIKGAETVYWLYPLIILLFYLLPSITASVFNLILMMLALMFTYHEFSEFNLVRIFFTLILTNLFSLIFSKYLETQNRSLLLSNRSSNLRNEVLELSLNSSELPKILTKIVSAIENEIPNSIGSILLLDESGKHLLHGAAPNLPSFYSDALNGLAIGKGVGSCGNAAFMKKFTIVEDISTHPFWLPWRELANKAGLKSCWSSPIINNEEKVIGTFAIYQKVVSQPANEELLLIEHYTNLAKVAIERINKNNVIWKLAHYDSLTGLPNRHMFQQQIKKALDQSSVSKQSVSLAILDLDNFKNINDSLGHEAGDFVLKESAKRIQKSINNSGVLFRLGGDEFVILIEKSSSAAALNTSIAELLQILAKPYYFKGKVVNCSASIGIATYPDNANSVKSMLRNADQAMYLAKKQGRNQSCHFTESMLIEYNRRKETIHDLRQAIKNNEFLINYQPIVNMQTGDISKVEALIRWQHPKKGIISPLDFIAIAEESGLIVDISNWVFEEVLGHVQYWKKTFNSQFQVKINTSPILYMNDGIILKKWLTSMRQKGISTSAIGLEITEDLLMENKAEVSKVIDFMRINGTEVSIDDFGTGYSSFSYLKEFSIDYIKIDKSFVDSIADNNNDIVLCEAIIMMAKKLNILVIAEGIETLEQFEKLKRSGCDFGQGYYLHKPLSKDHLENVLINLAKKPE